MFKRVAATLLTTLLAGCVYYPPYQYVSDPGGDYYYQAEPDGYGYGYGYASIGYGSGPGCGYYGHGWWPYYSPCYSWYPGYGFFYGVTWFPYWGWGGYDHWAWYHPYSPYRYSYYDHYYDYQGDWRRHHDQNGPRFGSASNEAERLANLSSPRASTAGAGGYAGGAPRWSRERDEGGTRGGYPDVRGNAINGGAGWGGRNAGDWRGRNPGYSGYSGAPVRYTPAPGNSGGRGQMPHRSSSPPSRGGGGFDRGGGSDSGSRSAPASRPWSESHSNGRERDPD